MKQESDLEELDYTKYNWALCDWPDHPNEAFCQVLDTVASAEAPEPAQFVAGEQGGINTTPEDWYRMFGHTLNAGTDHSISIDMIVKMPYFFEWN